jgi:hypothetical protein
MAHNECVNGKIVLAVVATATGIPFVAAMAWGYVVLGAYAGDMNYKY